MRVRVPPLAPIFWKGRTPLPESSSAALSRFVGASPAVSLNSEFGLAMRSRSLSDFLTLTVGSDSSIFFIDSTDWTQRRPCGRRQGGPVA